MGTLWKSARGREKLAGGNTVIIPDMLLNSGTPTTALVTDPITSRPPPVSSNGQSSPIFISNNALLKSMIFSVWRKLTTRICAPGDPLHTVMLQSQTGHSKRQRRSRGDGNGHQGRRRRPNSKCPYRLLWRLVVPTADQRSPPKKNTAEDHRKKTSLYGIKPSSSEVLTLSKQQNE